MILSIKREEDKTILSRNVAEGSHKPACKIQSVIMLKSKPCPDCNKIIEPCQAKIPELGPDAICGVWECALNEHWRTDCTAIDNEEK